MEAQKELDLLNSSLNWLVLIVSGVLLSYYATERQREALCLSLAGDREGAEAVGNVLPIRRLVSIFILLALTFFFQVSLKGEEQACLGGDPAAIRSAGRNRWAALLVLAAGVLRLFDVFESKKQFSQDEDPFF